MRGLILKDYYLARRDLAIIIIGIIIAVPAIIIFIPEFIPRLLPIIFVICSILLSVCATTYMLNDSTSHWNEYSSVLPVSRKDLVKSKYILQLLFSILGITLCTILVTPFFLMGFIDINNILLKIWFSFAFVLIASALDIPVSMFTYHKWNKSFKAKEIFLIIVGVSYAVLVWWIAWRISTNIYFNTLGVLDFVFLFMPPVVVFLSYSITCRLYEKQELI